MTVKRHKNALVSKMAAAALAFGIAQGAAGAATAQTAPDIVPTDTTITTTAAIEYAPIPTGSAFDRDPQGLLEAFQVAQATGTGEQIDAIAQTVETAAQEQAQAQRQAQVQSISSRSIQFDPLLPIALIAGLGLAYGGFCMFAARRRMQGAWLRAAAGGAMVLTLLNPEILEEQREILPTEVAIVVDRSASQGLDNRGATTQATYDALMTRLSGLEGVNIRTIEVDGQRDGQALDGTHLFTLLETSLSDIPRDRLGAVIMLTDGQVHDIPADTAALGRGVPLHVLVSGKEGETDRRIVIDQAPRFSLVNEEQTITFRIVDDGVSAPSGTPVSVTLSADGQVIATQNAVVGVPTTMTVTIPHTGANLIELRAATLDGELTDVNNRIVVPIEGIRENLNVLLVSGEPNAGARMWRTLLKSDPGTDLVHFTILRPPVKQDFTPLDELALIPFPVNELFVEKINDFDLIIFDHYETQGLLPAFYMNNIADYVRNGGALMVVSGPEYAGRRSLAGTLLSSVLPAQPNGPVSEGAYLPQVSDVGQRHPVTRNLAPLPTDGGEATLPSWGRWYNIVDSTVQSGQTVMTGPDGKPLLVLDRQGEGRVAMLMSDNAWLWSRGYEGGGPYAEMLRQTAHWLMKNPQLEEEALTMRRDEEGRLVIEQQTLGTEGRTVTLRSPSGQTQEVTLTPAAPGLFRAVIETSEIGLYSAELPASDALETPQQTTYINIGPANPREFVSTLSTLDLLSPMTTATGGAITRMAAADETLVTPNVEARAASAAASEMSGEGWIGVRMTDVTILKGIEQTPMIPAWLGFLASVGLLAGAWYKEGDGKLLSRNPLLGRGRKKPTAPAPS